MIAPDDGDVPAPTPPIEKAPEAPSTSLPERKRGYINIPRAKKKPSSPGLRSIDDMVVEVEQKEGKVIPELVMLVVRAYRTLEATNRAQREVIGRMGEELKALKLNGKGRR